MTSWSSRRPWRRAWVAVGTTVALAGATLVSLSTSSEAATQLPCDIYGSAGTPCVAAHSTTRALYAGYSGALYQVRRASDSATTDIAVLAAGGYANAATQDSFCAGTTCLISEIYDQSPQHNNLTIEGPGFLGGQSIGASATALPVRAGGHRVYGVDVVPTVGYRDNTATGTAANGQPEGMYMVASGTNANDGCCFDYGNTERTNYDTGNGHMDAVNLAYFCDQPPCNGPGPWVHDDLENGAFQGGGVTDSNDVSQSFPFLTALAKNNGQTSYALKGGSAQAGNLTTLYNGALPCCGYTPMHQEGGIVLGTGGDNSHWATGSFFEGVMTAGYPTDAADNAVQANIVSVGYSGVTGGVAPGKTITAAGGQCVDVAGDDTGGDGATVELWTCQSGAVDQHWTHNPDNSLTTLGRCLDLNGNGTANGTRVQLWSCNGVGGQKWVQQADGSLRNPQSGRCLNDPSGNTANGTALQLSDCNGSSTQKFTVNGGGAIVGTGAVVPCVDVAGDDTGGNGAAVELWNCLYGPTDMHWTHGSDGTVRTLGRCLDIIGNATANDTAVDLWDCNGLGGQVWQQQADGSLRNPQSGRCLDDPAGNLAPGTHLRIADCTGATAQKFALT